MEAPNPASDAVRGLVTVKMKVAGGPWFIELSRLLDEPIYLGPYENPATARADAKKLTAYLTALVERGPVPADPV
jgi:hypothetical protein